jgi:hypothetical protein
MRGRSVRKRCYNAGMPRSRPIINPIRIRALGNLRPGPSELDIGEAFALGAIDGAKVLTVTGRRGNVDAEAEAWGGTAAAPTRSDTPAAITLVSSSADDSAAGNGANAIVVEYLDSDGYERAGICVPTGIAPAAVVQARVEGVGNDATLVPLDPVVPAVGYRTNRCYVIAAGGGAAAYDSANVGTITVSIGANPQLVIAPAQNWSASSVVTVPRGKIGTIGGFGYGTDGDLKGLVTVITRQYPLPRLRLVPFEAAAGSLSAPVVERIRIAGRGEFGLVFEKEGGGSNINVSSALQVRLYPDPTDPDPSPELQPPFLG